ncbi:hypothetical protein P152DRAFT_50642 [Eremomyces bilateralis CBS 781.70]|uniref:Uncharacterized protein n=1 Tax=Eremomyces bilateralis CBS 781.70 TaxID=1392243 RepID=A0A6G1G135_9PEZI|nr:uncharacterized protein P152DRAFT_50642 [Eremomyces bilateralis CBS 781.70]KAF1811764.1 hypothetical protein P152DRAFT_50642 [Eremomyces bilateralis CBS 781.70]
MQAAWQTNPLHQKPQLFLVLSLLCRQWRTGEARMAWLCILILHQSHLSDSSFDNIWRNFREIRGYVMHCRHPEYFRSQQGPSFSRLFQKTQESSKFQSSGFVFQMDSSPAIGGEVERQSRKSHATPTSSHTSASDSPFFAQQVSDCAQLHQEGFSPLTRLLSRSKKTPCKL